MSETRRITLGRILASAAVLEMGTGLALLVDPAIFASWLLGGDLSGVGIPLGRVLGTALLALGLACWPGRQGAEGGSPAFRAMLTYNSLIAFYLVFLGTVRHEGGVLLWPAVVLHAVVVVLLVWKR